MKKKVNCWYNRFLTVALTVLGFGSTLMFMACYAPPPSELRYMDADEAIQMADSVNVDAVEDAVVSEAEETVSQ